MVALGLFIVVPAFAQEGASETSTEDQGLFERIEAWYEALLDATDTFNVSSSGFAYVAIQDTRMTPDIFRAPAFSVFNQTRSYRERETVVNTVSFEFAYPLSERTINSPYVNPRGSLSFEYLRRISELPLSLGGGLSLAGNLRTYTALSNSSLNYDLAASLRASVRWQDEFSLLGRMTSWHAHASFPLLSYTVRMPYFNVAYGGTDQGFAAPWQFYRMRIHVGLSRMLARSSENRMTFDYVYDLYGATSPEDPFRFTTAKHSLSIGYALKIR
jgi:hypothetical protein